MSSIPDERGQAGHAEDAQRRRERGAGRVEGARSLCRHDRRFPPAEIVHDPRPLLDPLGTGGDDLPDGTPGQRLADRERRHVRAHVVHPAAHVRVDRDERVANEELAVHGVGQLDLGELEVRRNRHTLRTGGKPDLARPQRHRWILRSSQRRSQVVTRRSTSYGIFSGGCYRAARPLAMSFDAGRREAARPASLCSVAEGRSMRRLRLFSLSSSRSACVGVLALTPNAPAGRLQGRRV